MPYGDAYSFEEIVNDQTNMPAAMRAASDRIMRALERYDFDLGGPLYDGKPIRTVDCGDVPADPRDLKAHYRRCEAAVRKILAAGALPIVIGGDHGIPIRVARYGPGAPDHARADRPAHRLARSRQRRARRLFQPDPPGVGDGPC